MANLALFQPLMPEDRVSGPLLDVAGALLAEGLQLAASAGPALTQALRPRLRAMNSYYSNRIEGQHTRPSDIERALKHDFDSNIVLARKQRLALVHMEAEEQLETEFDGSEPRDLFNAATVARIHECLYARLPEEERLTDEGDPVEPGAWRTRPVAVGNHFAPSPEDVPVLLDAWADQYRLVAGRERLLVALACSHHRLAWIHPFRDGNGRVARLHSHLLLRSMGLARGLWSPMRGLARSHQDYYARLANADLPHRNDLDGRGSRSQEELVLFVQYFLGCCRDQISFLGRLLSLEDLKSNLAVLLRQLESNPWQIGSEKSVVKPNCLEALHYCSIVGPVERSRFVAMTGLEDRTGRRVLAGLLDYGVLRAESHRAPVSFALPHAALRFVFPGLWPEAETE